MEVRFQPLDNEEVISLANNDQTTNKQSAANFHSL